MCKLNCFLILILVWVPLRAMDEDQSIAAARRLSLMIQENNGEYDWIRQGCEVYDLLKACSKEHKGYLLYQVMVKDTQHAYDTWMHNIITHLCNKPKELLAHLEAFSKEPHFRFSDAACYTLLSQLSRNNFDDTTAISCIEYLIKQKWGYDCTVNINCTNELGRTPLTEYVAFNRIALAEYLIKCGAAITHIANDNYCVVGNKRTPILHYVRSLRMLELLLKSGMDKNIRNGRGNTLLHIFAESVLIIDIADVLIQHAADVNAQNNKGNTPLHIAVKCNNGAAQEWFVRNGADCFATNKAGEVALPITLSKAYTREILQNSAD